MKRYTVESYVLVKVNLLGPAQFSGQQQPHAFLEGRMERLLPGGQKQLAGGIGARAMQKALAPFLPFPPGFDPIPRPHRPLQQRRGPGRVQPLQQP